MKLDFDEIYNTMSPKIYRYLRRLMGSRVTAEDLLQETFLQLHIQLESGKVIQNVRAWLFKVATNLAKNKKLSQIRTSLREECYASRPMIVDIHLRLENQQIIRQTLARLSPRMRQVLLLFAEGFSYREISEITEIEAAYVGVLLQRARAAFKRYYQEQSERQYEEQGRSYSMRR